MESHEGPRRLGRYELLFPIAAGGMAKVYAARVVGQGGFQKLVAVKCMLPDLADDPEFRTMFLDEAKVAAHVSSPNVVSTHDLGSAQDGTLFIAMELVVGLSLARLTRAAREEQGLPLPVALAVLADTAQGLHDAHEARTPAGAAMHIVHRDVSPQNVLVGVDGRARLTDFGVARAVLRATRTVTGHIKGKFSYCSPEQVHGLILDRRSDVFSLGIVAWEMLTGRRLFKADHPMATMKRVCELPIPSVRSVRSDVPEQVDAVIAWALERDRDDRAPTARAFSEALRAAAADSGRVMADRDGVSRFVESTGDDALTSLRDRIQRAMASHEELDRIAKNDPIIDSLGTDSPVLGGLLTDTPSSGPEARHDSEGGGWATGSVETTGPLGGTAQLTPITRPDEAMGSPQAHDAALALAATVDVSAARLISEVPTAHREPPLEHVHEGTPRPSSAANVEPPVRRSTKGRALVLVGVLLLGSTALGLYFGSASLPGEPSELEPAATVMAAQSPDDGPRMQVTEPAPGSPPPVTISSGSSQSPSQPEVATHTGPTVDGTGAPTVADAGPSSATRRRSRRPRPAAQAAGMLESSSAEPVDPDQPVEPASSPSAMDPRPRGLRGLDAFERDLRRQR